MVRIEKRKITSTPIGRAILSLNMKYLTEIGLDAGKEYTVIYEDGKLSVVNKEIKSVTVD